MRQSYVSTTDTSSSRSVKKSTLQPKWGLLIQGPRFSSGKKGARADVPDSPVVNANFDCVDTVRKNLARWTLAGPAVLSTWAGSGFEMTDISIIESEEPLQDWDNRRKQFVSTLAGIEALVSAGCTHAVKIRTDQLMPESLFDWIRFEVEESGKIVVSDLLDHVPFYVGDFIWAGTLDALEKMVRGVLAFGAVRLDPGISQDWVLKYMVASEAGLWTVVSKDASLALQIRDFRNPNLLDFWQQYLDSTFVAIPTPALGSILWRGREMRNVIPVDKFSGGEDSPSKLTSSKRGRDGAHISGPILKPVLSLYRDWRRYRRTIPRGVITTYLRGIFTGRYQAF